MAVPPGSSLVIVGRGWLLWHGDEKVSSADRKRQVDSVQPPRGVARREVPFPQRDNHGVLGLVIGSGCCLWLLTEPCILHLLGGGDDRSLGGQLSLTGAVTLEWDRGRGRVNAPHSPSVFQGQGRGSGQSQGKKQEREVGVGVLLPSGSSGLSRRIEVEVSSVPFILQVV